jgi:hypothetical protein
MSEQLHVLATFLRRNHFRCALLRRRRTACVDVMETSGRFRDTSNQATSSPEPDHYTNPHINKFGRIINRYDIITTHISFWFLVRLSNNCQRQSSAASCEITWLLLIIGGTWRYAVDRADISVFAYGRWIRWGILIWRSGLAATYTVPS